jgi:UDP-N-acetylglucosamine 2-epimerase (non-hydrolysing)
VLVCFGTRPEVIKLAPVVAALEADGRFELLRVTTGQHREMLDQMLATFGLEVDVDLALMSPRQELYSLAGRALLALGPVIEEHAPDALLVQGDTTTAFCAGFAGFYGRVPVGHVEAGLRTDDPQRPFPEEINRRLITPVARWQFCPTEGAADNLRSEGVPEDEILVTGNTVIDALLSIAARSDEARYLPPKRRARRIVVTLHRRETHGEPQRRLCAMLAAVAQREDVEIVFPVHLSPVVRESVFSELEGMDNVHLIEPCEYLTFVALMNTADLIVSDSGGVQEEAPSLDVPVLVMRDTTERPEGIDAGCALLSGTDPDGVRRDIESLLDSPERYAAMAAAPNPYGDGRASQRIVDRLARDLLSD